MRADCLLSKIMETGYFNFHLESIFAQNECIRDMNHYLGGQFWLHCST